MINRHKAGIDIAAVTYFKENIFKKFRDIMLNTILHEKKWM